MDKRFAIKFSGQSGQGINTLGKLLSNAIKNSEYPIFATREYPSLIKGGFASYQIDVSSTQIFSSSKQCNILTSIAKDALNQYIGLVSKDGLILHSVKDFKLNAEDKEYILKNNIKYLFIDTEKIAQESNSPTIMANIVMLGAIWKVIGLDFKVLERVIRKYFSTKKNIDIEAEVRCLKAGYNLELIKDIKIETFPTTKIKGWKKSKILTGNDALALGAISAGCRAYYAYPMTPATSILETLGNTYMETGLIVKQAESEITAVQFAMGSMYMGTRAFTATSGGGFDLMTETISCCGMTETPLVIVLGQRAGSGTGVPTWSGSSDLEVSLKGGHGEFPRCILATSDSEDSYELIQDAFNIAEQYQIPVIVLSEKQIAESLFNIKTLPKPKKILRGLSNNGIERYKITKSGVSQRWIPQKGKKTYLVNSDEHTQDGISTEDSKEITAMSSKRLRKLNTLLKNIPSPEYYGAVKPDIVFVGMGSTKNAVIDAMKILNANIGYLHYKYIYPLRSERILQIHDKGTKIVLIENNQNGELGKLIREQSGLYIQDKLFKFDGRPFFVEDILEYLKK